jgi:hypothetical protein
MHQYGIAPITFISWLGPSLKGCVRTERIIIVIFGRLHGVSGSKTQLPTLAWPDHWERKHCMAFFLEGIGSRGSGRVLGWYSDLTTTMGNFERIVSGRGVIICLDESVLLYCVL